MQQLSRHATVVVAGIFLSGTTANACNVTYEMCAMSGLSFDSATCSCTGQGLPANRGSRSQSGGSSGEWTDQVSIDYPMYGPGVPKPWDENAHFWLDVFKDKYDLECGNYGSYDRCAVAWAEYARHGICGSQRAGGAYMNDWLQMRNNFLQWTGESRVQQPNQAFGAC